MSDQVKEMYCGSAKKLPFDGMLIQLDLTELFEYTKGEAKDLIKEYTDKNGKIHKTLNIVAFPRKTETKYSTHTVKIAKKYESENKDKEEPKDDLPF